MATVPSESTKTTTGYVQVFTPSGAAVIPSPIITAPAVTTTAAAAAAVTTTEDNSAVSTTDNELIYTGRKSAFPGNPMNGVLELPEVTNVTRYEYVINRRTLIARSGDAFGPAEDPENEQVVLMIPAYTDGVLWKIAQTVDGDAFSINTMNDAVIAAAEVAESDSRNIGSYGFALKATKPGHIIGYIIFKYAEALRWCTVSDIFLDAIRLVKLFECNPKKRVTLRIPTFGTNNAITYFDSACGIAYGLHECSVGIPEDSIVTKFEVVTLASLASSRVIAHIGNCLRSLVSGLRSGDVCDMCYVNNRSVLLKKCGHRVTCLPCIRKIVSSAAAKEKNPPKCPVCRAQFESMEDTMFVPRVIDQSKEACACCNAQRTEESVDLGVFIPCGHYKVVCKQDRCVLMALESTVCMTCKCFAEYRKAYIQSRRW